MPWSGAGAAGCTTDTDDALPDVSVTSPFPRLCWIRGCDQPGVVSISLTFGSPLPFPEHPDLAWVRYAMDEVMCEHHANLLRPNPVRLDYPDGTIERDVSLG